LNGVLKGLFVGDVLAGELLLDSSVPDDQDTVADG
jgi:hypothetical protein